jgi:Putative lactococcus lactis phage r1t holin
MYGWSFWKDALERAIKTAAQAVVTALGIGGALNQFTWDWKLAWQFAVGGLITSLLTSVASSPIADNGSASVLK